MGSVDPLANLAAIVARMDAKLDALGSTPAPVAVKRSVAAKMMGISTRKLEQLITAGKVRTTEDTRLVPVAEVKRYCAPKAPRQRRRLGGHRVRRTTDGQSDEAIEAARRAMRGAR